MFQYLFEVCTLIADYNITWKNAWRFMEVSGVTLRAARRLVFIPSCSRHEVTKFVMYNVNGLRDFKSVCFIALILIGDSS